jgi:hypothetical protein
VYLVTASVGLEVVLMYSLKSLRLLWTCLARNQRYRPFVTEDDIQYFERRATNEGLVFLTQGLPQLGKALDRYHSTKEWMCPPGFDFSGGYPFPMYYVVEYGKPELITAWQFMGKAFDAALKGNPAAVDCVRQLSYVFYKLEVGYEESVIEDFLINFKRVDSDLPDFSDSNNHFIDLLLEGMKKAIARVLCNADPRDITPSHGGGATACRTKNWDKYHKLQYFEKLDNIFPYSDYFFLSPTHLSDELQALEAAEIANPTARVCLVPKDSRGPRVISCEPAAMMFIQQGLMRKLYKTIESHPITRGHVNFSDQSINQLMARLGSLSNELATIDLKDASDRVSLSLVRRVFPSHWLEALEACRSENTILPNGEIVKLNKFAPMGSACCFPVEALVFWACADVAIRTISGRSSRELCVYGDDIIIPSKYAEVVIHSLETIGLLVNRDKCYVDGPFRESCGGDYYLGVDVTPVRFKKPIGLSGTMLERSADFVNEFITKFGYAEARDVIAQIEQDLGYVFPRTEMDLPGTIRVTASASNDVFFVRRWNKKLQRHEHRVMQSVCKVIQRRPPNWGELFRKQLSASIVKQPDRYQNSVAIRDSKCLPGQYTDPHSVSTKWVWCWLGEPDHI